MNEIESAVYCGWFTFCFNLATGTTDHPILGAVPTCDSCHKFTTMADEADEHAAEQIDDVDEYDPVGCGYDLSDPKHPDFPSMF